MNKKLCWSTAVLTLLSPLAAVGDEGTGPTIWDGFSGFLSPDWDRDVSAALGAKIWVNDWTRGRAFFSSAVVVPETFAVSVDSAPDSAESDIEAVPIPQLSVRYKWLFVAGSYYAKTGFDFDDSVASTRVVVDTDSDGIPDSGALSTALFSTSGDRYEWDAAAGVYIHPYVALLGGYKKVRQEIDVSITETTQLLTPTAASPPSTVSQRIFNDIDIEGPTIGIAASVPIGRGFGFYASYAHGFMDTEIRDVNRTLGVDFRAPDLDTTYDVAELGFSYSHGTEGLAAHLPLSAATVYAGYRYQYISTEFNEPKLDRFVDAPGQDASDITKGFAVGVNLSF